MDVRDRIGRALLGVERVPCPPGPPPSGADVGEDLGAAFDAALGRAGGEVFVVPDLEHARSLVRERAQGRTVAWADDAPGEDVLRQAEIGVDVADLLVAETGTVVRTFASPEAARVTLVPPVAVFLASDDALVRDLPEALRRVAARHESGRAATVFVTGPSRTADIEKQLVIPAHGPRALLVIRVGAL